MNDLHARFDDWLAEGAAGDVPRDVAVHASACEGCLAASAGFDSLLAVDVGAADPPVLSIVTLRPARPLAIRAARIASGVATIGFIATAVVIGASSMRNTDVADAPRASVAPAPVGEGVLAGQPTPSPSPSATAPPSPTPTADPSASLGHAPSMTPAPSVPSAPPVRGVPQPPPVTPRPTAVITPPVSTPRPTATATVAPSPSPPPPSPTPDSSEVASPLPTPTPTPSEAPTSP